VTLESTKWETAWMSNLCQSNSRQASAAGPNEVKARRFVQRLRSVPDPCTVAARLSRALNFHWAISINDEHNRGWTNVIRWGKLDDGETPDGRFERDTSRYSIVIDNRYYLMSAGCAKIIVRSFAAVRRKLRDSARRSPRNSEGGSCSLPAESFNRST